MMKIEVTLLAKEPSKQEDAMAPGVYRVDFDSPTDAYSNTQMASAAMGIFHINIPILVPADFKIAISTEDGKEIGEDSTHETLAKPLSGTVSKISGGPAPEGSYQVPPDLVLANS
ncbi:hypothetical protein BH11PSE11_BH11PSE11_03000 [soil metagenome]